MEPAPDLAPAQTGEPASTPGRPTRFGQWVVRRRVPLVVIPLLIALIIASSKGAELLLEEVPQAQSPGVTCWDGDQAPTGDDCPLPTGTQGLRWVFPSFTPRRDDCRDLVAESSNSPRPTEWLCEVEIKGEPVTISYIQLAGARAGRRFYDKRFDGVEPESVEDDTGRVYRYEWRGPRGGGFELATVYRDFPYAVTVRSETSLFRDKAFRTMVRFRQPPGLAVRSPATRSE